MEPIIRVEHLTHTYSAGTPFQRSAVEDVSIDVMPGEFLGIIGHTGSGKSTLMQQLNAMQMQAANCCCENRAAIAQVRYDMAAQACDTRNTVQNATRDIIDNANSNSRAILDFLTQSKLSDLQAENQGLKLAASQAAQNSYLVSQLRPSPIPAYTVQNPYCCNQFACCGC